MLVTVALFELHIEYAQSLKEKRMVVKSLVDKIRHRFEISANEVALHDLHQRARIALSLVTLDRATSDGLLDRIRTFVETNTDARMTGWTSEQLEFDEMADLT